MIGATDCYYKLLPPHSVKDTNHTVRYCNVQKAYGKLRLKSRAADPTQSVI